MPKGGNFLQKCIWYNCVECYSLFMFINFISSMQTISNRNGILWSLNKQNYLNNKNETKNPLIIIYFT